MSQPDKKAIVCNYIESTKIVTKGSLAYVCQTEGGAENLKVLVRSRGGRLICKWERIKRLTNFRAKTVPEASPRYFDKRIIDFSNHNHLTATLNWFTTIKRLEK